MKDNFWGRYLKDSPKTHYDPFQTFIEKNIPKGFRVNFLPSRNDRPREQHINFNISDHEEKITKTEIDNSTLTKVYRGQSPCVPIAGDDTILGDPDADELMMDFSSFDGISVMNKFAPLGIYSQEATGVATVNIPKIYVRNLQNANANYSILRPMRATLAYLLEGNTYRSDLFAPLAFFNVGPNSGSSIKYLHSQTYAMPYLSGINSYSFQKTFDQNKTCTACSIISKRTIMDHLRQEINYHDLIFWEDENVIILYPYAPFRSMATRIIPKKHVSYIGKATDEMLKSIGLALKITDYLMNVCSPLSNPLIDRTIAFRQTTDVRKDFHMIIDVLPPFPTLAAESVDFLGMTPYDPFKMANKMKNINLNNF